MNCPCLWNDYSRFLFIYVLFSRLRLEYQQHKCLWIVPRVIRASLCSFLNYLLLPSVPLLFTLLSPHFFSFSSCTPNSKLFWSLEALRVLLNSQTSTLIKACAVSCPKVFTWKMLEWILSLVLVTQLTVNKRRCFPLKVDIPYCFESQFHSQDWRVGVCTRHAWDL